MTIQVGEKVPSLTLYQKTDDGIAEISTDEIFNGRKVVLFALPGAFTPTCSAYHLPGYVEHAEDFSNQGIDAIACMSVNDVFVMHAWGRSSNADGIDMLADGNAEFTQALGLELDGTAFGMGKRSQRFALIADNGIVTDLMVEAPGEYRVSSAESVLATL